jgi:hypothetical protein
VCGGGGAREGQSKHGKYIIHMYENITMKPIILYYLYMIIKMPNKNLRSPFKSDEKKRKEELWSPWGQIMVSEILTYSRSFLHDSSSRSLQTVGILTLTIRRIVWCWEVPGE